MVLPYPLRRTLDARAPRTTRQRARDRTHIRKDGQGWTEDDHRYPQVCGIIRISCRHVKGYPSGMCGRWATPFRSSTFAKTNRVGTCCPSLAGRSLDHVASGFESRSAPSCSSPHRGPGCSRTVGLLGPRGHPHSRREVVRAFGKTAAPHVAVGGDSLLGVEEGHRANTPEVHGALRGFGRMSLQEEDAASGFS